MTVSPDKLMSEEEIPDYEDLPSQMKMMDSEPWDILLVLDACRWDAYCEIYRDTLAVRSPTNGSTPGWIDNYWTEREWPDLTYVSANPQVGRVGKENRPDSKHISEVVKKHVTVEPQRHYTAVHPDVATNAARSEEPPMVVHYIQPHTPYIGNVKLQIPNKSDRYSIMPEKHKSSACGPVHRLTEKGHISIDLLKTAYLSNLILTKSAIRNMINAFPDSKVVITADHGEAFGPDTWDHGGPTTNRNRVVPWDARYVDRNV